NVFFMDIRLVGGFREIPVYSCLGSVGLFAPSLTKAKFQGERRKMSTECGVRSGGTPEETFNRSKLRKQRLLERRMWNARCGNQTKGNEGKKDFLPESLLRPCYLLFNSSEPSTRGRARRGRGPSSCRRCVRRCRGRRRLLQRSCRRSNAV